MTHQTPPTAASEALAEFTSVGNYEVLGKTRETIETALSLLDRVQRGVSKELARELPKDVLKASFSYHDKQTDKTRERMGIYNDQIRRFGQIWDAAPSMPDTTETQQEGM